MPVPALYQLYLQYPSVQTDTRKLQPGDIFFALKGPNFNGNAFAQKALESGASYAIIDEQQYAVNEKCILVKDTLAALQELAHYHRSQLNIPFLAITGSNGKTTTKELVKSVLAAAYTTYATEGNLNNHIGIPLTVLKIKRDVQIAIIEMGANHQGEIKSYCEIVNPTHGLITNVGKAHLEGFGGEEGVRKGKGELYDHLRQNKGTAFVCTDMPHLPIMAQGIPHIITYGTSNADITGNNLPSDFFLTVQTDNIFIKTKLTGAYNFYNVMAAVAVGKYFKVDMEKIRHAIEAYIPSNNRSQIIQRGTNTIILDAYNANPSSMKAAIENFAAMKADKKIVLLGAMRELGKESLQEHEAIIHLLQQYNWQQVILVGGDFKNVSHPYLYFPDSLAAGDWFHHQQWNHAHILIKGSRGIAMEKVLE